MRADEVRSYIMRVRVVDRLPQFGRSVVRVLDEALQEGARDILINAKTKAPFEKGGLRSNTTAKRFGQLAWRVSFWEEYARFQELGGDSRRKVRNYTTPGTGKHYLKDAGDAIAKKIQGVLKKHARRAR